MSIKLHRFHTYPHQKINEDVRRVRSFENREGNTIELKITDTVRGKFFLKYGKHEIVDTLADFWDRKHLYDLLDPDIFDWLLDVKESVETEELEETGVVKATMTLNTDRFVLTVNKKTESATLRISEQLREFKLDTIFIENPDLPMMLDGRLIEYFQKKLEEKGIRLPDIPYFPSLNLTQK